MSDEEKRQLEFINQNLVILARNQAVLYSEISLIQCSLKTLQGMDKANEEIVQA